MKVTYYIVQTSPSEFLGRSCGELGRETARAAEDALAKMREMMREIVNAEYREFDDYEIPGGSIDAVLDEIIEGNPDGNEWSWDATNRAVKWRIIRPEDLK